MKKPYRSSIIVDGLDRTGMRAHLKAIGLLDEELQKPFIGIANTWNEMHPGHKHLREDRPGSKRCIRMAGGVPFEFNTISLCDGLPWGILACAMYCQPGSDCRFCRASGRRPAAGLGWCLLPVAIRLCPAC